jgi:hypothetical protein
VRAAALLPGLFAAAAAAQSPIYPSASGGTGAMARSYIFHGATGLDHASQFVVPIFAGMPIGRQFFLDVTSNYAYTEVAGSNGVVEQLDGFTDTQLRGTLTLGRDVAVLSVSLNLPTGAATVEQDQLSVLGNTAQTFLPFYVSNYGTGFGATTGLAVAHPFGAWNLGAAGALRYVGGYQPIRGVSGNYQPGVEGRIRVGADRLLGERSRLTFGLTWTNFATDEFSGQLQTGDFRYKPGGRVIGELGLSHQVGRSTVQGYGWAYFRQDGLTTDDSTSLQTGAENLVHLGVLWLTPVGTKVVLDPGLDLRLWYPDRDYGGYLVALRLGARFRLAEMWTLAPALGWADGRTTTSAGEGPVQGWSATLMLRVGR